MTFDQALIRMRWGHRVSREGWNGKGMWIVIHTPTESGHRPYIQMKDAQGLFVPWLASQTDILADDWEDLGR